MTIDLLTPEAIMTKDFFPEGCFLIIKLNYNSLDIKGKVAKFGEVPYG